VDNSVAVEFDTCNNGSCAGDPNDNHVGVDANGSLDRSLLPSPTA